MVLSVKCNTTTAPLFTELGNSDACITQEKANALNARIDAEAAAKNKRLTRVFDKLVNGEITQDQYDKILAALSSLTITEDLTSPAPSDVNTFSHAMKSVAPMSPLMVGISEEYLDAMEQQIIRSTPRSSSKSRLELLTPFPQPGEQSRKQEKKNR